MLVILSVFPLHLIFSDFNRGLAFNRRKQGAQQVQVRVKSSAFSALGFVSCVGLAWIRALCSIMSHLPTESLNSY